MTGLMAFAPHCTMSGPGLDFPTVQKFQRSIGKNKARCYFSLVQLYLDRLARPVRLSSRSPSLDLAVFKIWQVPFLLLQVMFVPL